MFSVEREFCFGDLNSAVSFAGGGSGGGSGGGRLSTQDVVCTGVGYVAGAATKSGKVGAAAGLACSAIETGSTPGEQARARSELNGAYGMSDRYGSNGVNTGGYDAPTNIPNRP